MVCISEYQPEFDCKNWMNFNFFPRKFVEQLESSTKFPETFQNFLKNERNLFDVKSRKKGRSCIKKYSTYPLLQKFGKLYIVISFLRLSFKMINYHRIDGCAQKWCRILPEDYWYYQMCSSSSCGATQFSTIF